MLISLRALNLAWTVAVWLWEVMLTNEDLLYLCSLINILIPDPLTYALAQGLYMDFLRQWGILNTFRKA